MFVGATEALNLLAISGKHSLINTATYKKPHDQIVIPYQHENRASAGVNKSPV